MDWLFQSAIDFFFNLVPLWIWLSLAVVAILIAFRVLGKEGVFGLLLLIAAFFGYRQGWKDKTVNKEPIVPLELPSKVKPKAKTTSSKREPLEDRLKRITGR